MTPDEVDTFAQKKEEPLCAGDAKSSCRIGAFLCDCRPFPGDGSGVSAGRPSLLAVGLAADMAHAPPRDLPRLVDQRDRVVRLRTAKAKKVGQAADVPLRRYGRISGSFPGMRFTE